MFVPLLLVCGMAGPTECRGLTDQKTVETEEECLVALMQGYKAISETYPDAIVVDADCVYFDTPT